VIVDIDGTITADRQVDCSAGTLAVIRSLIPQNSVYLFSNHRDSVRNRAVARHAGIALIETPHRKPNRKVLDSLPAHHRARRIVVIGDKRIADGLFAWRIGARFIRVARIVSPNDRFIAKMSYYLDDLISTIWEQAHVRAVKGAVSRPGSDSIAPLEESRRF